MTSTPPTGHEPNENDEDQPAQQEATWAEHDAPQAERGAPWDEQGFGSGYAPQQYEQGPYGPPSPGYGQDQGYYFGPQGYGPGHGHYEGHPGAPWSYAPPPPPGPSKSKQFWVGAALTVPGLFVVGLVTGFLSNVATSIEPTLGSLVSMGLGATAFVAVIVGVVIEKTRWYAIGVIAAIGVLAILAAGACIVLLATLTGRF